MSIFGEIAKGTANLEGNILGPDYQYYNHINSPVKLGVSEDGDDIGTNLLAIEDYVSLLVSGIGGASDTGGPLGPRFYVQTLGKCKDVATKKIVTRSIYLDNVPTGNIPMFSSAMGMNLTTFEGLLPGILEDVGSLNPMNLFAAFQQGSTPDCKEVTFPVTGDTREDHPTSGYVAVSEINDFLADMKRSQTPANYAKLKAEGFGNMSKRKQVPGMANVYITGCGFLLVYLMYRMVNKK